MSSPPTLALVAHGFIPIDIAGVTEVELIELLGAGGFGQVWKAWDRHTNQFYALKFIQNLSPGSVMVERVRLEAEVAIPSDYIVPALGLREWDPITFVILFAYYDGQPLDRLLSQNVLSPDQKRQIFNQVLAGVADAHRCNIIHRDLKPSNILVSPDYHVKLIDFGISKFRGKGLTMSGDLMGTPQYLAPEVFLSGSVIADARADIFALGHILYELEMGNHFWKQQGWYRLEDLMTYLTRYPTPTEAIDRCQIPGHCYANAGDVIWKMVKIAPEERFATIQEVVDALAFAELAEVATPFLTPISSASSLSRAFLIVESGTNKDARTLLELADGETRVIGRVEIAGNNESISRRHLEFSRRDDQWWVRDMGSKNGTLLRGTALTSAMGAVPIQDQDRLRVGDVFLRLEFAP
jgi:eukaryotic-like serine/threonine-protein kinase